MESEHSLTNEQLLLMEVRDKLCHGNAAELARRIDKDPTYVNRLFYPEGKSGRKGIGLEIQQAVLKAFPLPLSFWSLPSPALTAEAVSRMKDHIAASDVAEHYAKHGHEYALPQRRRVRTTDALPKQLHDIAGRQTPAFLRVEEPRAAYGMEPILAWEHPDDLPPGEFVMVPRLDVKLSGGHGADQVEIELVKENPQAFRTEWLVQQRLKPGKLAAMRATGESMEPTIYAGDSLLVDTSQTDIIDGRVYALWYDGGERVKRLFRLPGGGLRIKSDNSAHPLIELEADHHGQVRVIGRVVHRSGTGGF